MAASEGTPVGEQPLEQLEGTALTYTETGLAGVPWKQHQAMRWSVIVKGLDWALGSRAELRTRGGAGTQMRAPVAWAHDQGQVLFVCLFLLLFVFGTRGCKLSPLLSVWTSLRLLGEDPWGSTAGCTESL